MLSTACSSVELAMRLFAWIAAIARTVDIVFSLMNTLRDAVVKSILLWVLSVRSLVMKARDWSYGGRQYVVSLG